MSQEEMQRKLMAIFKHQSRKDKAPFPGIDEREFWQRVEECNKHLAQQVDRLGLPEYYAMEAYVVHLAGQPLPPEIVPIASLGATRPVATKQQGLKAATPLFGGVRMLHSVAPARGSQRS